MIKPETYMRIAHVVASNSYCKKSKVGAIIVKNNSIISIGYNGTPSGFDNCCEEVRTVTEGTNEFDFYEVDRLVTKSEVLHAETNAILKCARDTVSTEGATLYTTVSPCIECAKIIYQAGIATVYYDEEYRDLSGVEFLHKGGVDVIKLHTE